MIKLMVLLSLYMGFIVWIWYLLECRFGLEPDERDTFINDFLESLKLLGFSLMLALVGVFM